MLPPTSGTALAALHLTMRVSFTKSTRFLTVALIALTSPCTGVVFGHGGENHGDQKPKSTANAKGVVSHSARLGDIEVMVKHPVFEPDQATTGRLFVTRFDTNEPFKDTVAKVEIESANGAIFTVTVEAGELPGAYSLKFPALPLGSYKMRTKVSHGGETDTVTFSGIDVKPVSSAVEGEASWLTKTLIGVVFSLVLALLGGLVYFVWRFAAGPKVSEEAFSA